MQRYGPPPDSLRLEAAGDSHELPGESCQLERTLSAEIDGSVSGRGRTRAFSMRGVPGSASRLFSRGQPRAGDAAYSRGNFRIDARARFGQGRLDHPD